MRNACAINQVSLAVSLYHKAVQYILVLILSQCALLSALAQIRDGGIDPSNLGKGEWLYFMSSATNQLGGYVASVTDENSLMLYLKSQGTRYVIVKAATSDQLFNGSYSSPQFTSNLVNTAHANGLLIFGYNRSYGQNIPGEIAISDYVFAQGADGFVWDAEAEWESHQTWIGTNGPALAWQLCSTVRSNWPNKFLAHSPFAIVGLHASFPYKEFGYWSDAVMPQIYHFSATKAPSAAINWTDVNWAYYQKLWSTLPPTNINGLTVYWTNAIKALAPIEDVYGPPFSSPTPDKDVQEFIDYLAADPNTPAPGGYRGANFFRADLHDAQQWAYISAGTPGNTPGFVNNIVMDNPSASVVGSNTVVRTFFVVTNSTPVFQGSGSGTDTNSFGTNYLTLPKGIGLSYARFTPNIVVPGDYTLYQWHPFRTDASASVPFVVNYNGGSTTVYANQQTNDGNWSLLGTFNFAAGTSGNVRITDAIAEPGAVAIADGLKLVFVPPTVAPAAPSGLKAIAVGISQISLIWSNTAVNAVNKVVARSTTDGGPYTDIVSLPLSSTGYVDTGLVAATPYYYVVRAVNPAGASPNSGQAGATTLAAPPTMPTIVAQPQSQTVPAGANATFSVTASGTAPLNYEWRFNGVSIPGATASAYTRANVQPGDAGSYCVAVTNAAGGVLTADAVLTVVTQASFSLTAYAGSNGSVTISPNQSSYAAGTVVTVTATPNAGYDFSGWSGDLTSTANPLFVTIAANITIAASFAPSPTDIIMDNTDPNVIFTGAWQTGTMSSGKYGPDYRFASTAAGGLSNATYRPVITVPGYYTISVLYTSGSNRATNAPYTIQTDDSLVQITRNQQLNNGIWVMLIYASAHLSPGANNYVQLSNDTGYSGKVVIADAVRFQLYQADLLGPAITAQPASQVLTVGGAASFGVAATGASPLSYYWQRNGLPVAGATDSSYTINNVQLADSGSQFSCLVSNAYGTVLSSNATLTVNPPPPCVPPPSGLVSWWRGEGDGTDSMGSNNISTLDGITFTAGEVGQSFNFDGGAHTVLVPDAPELNFEPNQDFAIEMWIRPQVETTSYDIMSMVDKRYSSGGTDSPQGYEFCLVSGQVHARFLSTGFGSSGPDLRDGKYHHVAWTLSRASTTGGNLYVDGSVVLTFDPTPYTGTLSNDQPLRLGNHADSTFATFFKGVIDEVSIYRRALSSNEIAAIYNAGHSGKCATPSPPAILTQPANQTVTAGASASFTVAAGGTPPLSYQWQFNGTNIGGATGSVLTLTNVQLAQAGNYAAQVTNAYGLTASSNAVLTVNQASPCIPAPTGLVSWWRGEGNALDQIGENNGVLLNGVGFDAGVVGQAFSFDANSQSYVEVPDSPALRLTDALTIECWAKRLNAAQVHVLVEKGGDWTGGQTDFGIGLNDTDSVGSHFTFTFAGGWRGCAVTPDTAWHHYAVVAVNGQANPILYVDGVPQTVVYGGGPTAMNMLPSTRPLHIGAQVDAQTGWLYYSSTMIDELAIYNRALSAAEIQAIYTAGAGGKCTAPTPPVIVLQPTNQIAVAGANITFSVLAAGTQPLLYQWRFDGTNLAAATASSLVLTNVQFANAGSYSVFVSNSVGIILSSNALLSVNPPPPCAPPPPGLVGWWRGEGNALDQAGGTNGILFNGVGFAAGVVGQAFSFDASSHSYVEVPDSPALRLTDALTIECWAKRLNAAQVHVLVEKGGDWTGGQTDFGIGLNDTDSVGSHFAFTFAGGWRGCAVTPDTAWHHYAAVAVNGQANPILYIDGVPQTIVYGGGPAAMNLLPSTRPLHIGAQVDSQTGWFYYSSTMIDELAIYNRALSAAEIQAIYNAGSSGKCLVPTVPVIQLQPTNQIANVGDNITFSVLAAGTQPLSYLWQRNGTPIAGASDSTCALTLVQLSDSGSQFSCLVSNAYGSVLSSNAVLTVMPYTGVVLSADFESGLQGFTIDNTYGSGNGLWHLSTGRAQDAGHSPTHSLYYGHNETSTGGGNYDTGVSGGVVTSPAISLPGTAPITLSFNYLLDVESLTSYDVAYVEVTTNNGASYVAVASKNAFGGLTSPSAGWVSNTVDLTAFAGTTLSLRFRFDTIDSVANATEGWYLDDIKVTAPTIAPSITAQPQSVSAFAGQTVAFSILASGSQPLSYYWNRDGAPIPGASDASYTANSVQLSDSGAQFSCLVSNAYGIILSSNAVLTVSPAPPCTAPPAGIVSWLHAEGNALDLTGLYNGTPVGGLGYVPGKVGQAFSFNGIDAEVDLGTSAGNFGTNDFTIEFWLQTTSTRAVESVLGKRPACDGDSTGFWDMRTVNGKLQMELMAPGVTDYNQLAGTRQINDGVYHHIAFVRLGNTGTLYIDGTYEVAGSTPGVTYLNTSGDFVIGRSACVGVDGTQYFTGQLDEITVYQQALSLFQVQSIYNAGGAGKCTSAAPTIVSPPANLTVGVGETATFSVWAGGTPPFSYQWLFETNPIGGATGSSLVLAGVQPQQAGNYSVIVTNPYGLVTSSNAVLTVLTFPPAIIIQPANQTVAAGTTALFTVTASGSPPLIYQWFLETNAITGGTNSSLVLNNVQPTQVGNYSVVVSNAYGTAASSNALLTVLTFPPTITSQPQSRTVFQGRAINFSVTATGTAPLSYQWFFNSNSLAGRTVSTLLLTNIQPEQAGAYSILVTNAYGSLMSSNAFLTVLPPPVCVSPPAGLVAWWRAESNTVDSVGLSDAAFQYVNSGFTGGKVGAAFRLTQGGYLRVPASSDLNLGPGAGLTIEGWIRPDTLTSVQPVAEWNNGLANIGAGLMLNSLSGIGVLEGYLADTNAKPTRSIVLRSPAYAITNLVWQHAALTFDKSNGVAAIYVNGISVAQTNLGTFLPATVQAPFYLGCRPSGTYAGSRFTGGLDEMSLYNRSLTAAELQSIVLADDQGKCPPPPPPCLPPVSGIVAWWRGQSNALDSVDSNTGLITSTVTYSTGKVATCFQFSTGYIRVPAASNLNVGVGPGLTIELWAKPTLWAPQPFVEWNSGTGAQGPTLCYPTSGPVLEANLMDTVGVSHLIQSPLGLITNNVWEHLAVTYDKTSGIAALYFNGIVVTQRNVGTFIPRTVSDVYLGYRPPGSYAGPGGKFTGGMDEVSLYGRALSSNEIRAIYLARDAGKCAIPAPPFIIWQPANRIVTPGGTATFTLQPPAGTPPFAYHWGHAGTNIAGASSSSLSIPGATLASAGAYSVVVTNSSGSITSAVATLTVNQPPIAFNVTAATRQNVPMSIPTEKLLMFALDPEGDPLTVVSIGASTNGAAVVLGGGVVTYTPVTGFIGNDHFAYTVADSWGGTGSAFVQVVVRAADQMSGNMLQPITTDAGFLVSFAAIPGRTYTIQRAESLSGPWLTLTTVTVGPSGLGVYEDTNAPPAGAYYRTTYP